MAYTKEEFKKLWESDEDGGGITYDDIVDCAKEWGVSQTPRTQQLQRIVYQVCLAAGVNEEDMPVKP